MDKLIIKPKAKSLGVKCAPGEISLSGNSILADPKVFFEPLFKWIEAYIEHPEEKTTVNLKLEYVDTASVQQILEMLTVFRKIKHPSREIIINWHYEIDDPELLELGEIMSGRIGMEFNFVKY